MLFRAFWATRKSAVFAFLALSLIIGGFEGLFVFTSKSIVMGTWTRGWIGAAIFMAVVVTGRTALQLLAAKWEVKMLSTWIVARRNALLDLTAGREFPCHRPPWQGRVTSALTAGLDGLNEGIMAGCRCLSALAQALVLAPLLFLYSWKLAFAALALALPALLASRLRVNILAATGKRRNDSKAELAIELEDYADGWESFLGNGRMVERTDVLAGVFDRHAGRDNAWETAKSAFPPALEWFFFLALAALVALASAGFAGSTGAGPLVLLPFGTLLLLLYRPIREWARYFPVYIAGDQSWRGYRNLCATLAAFPPRLPPAMARGGAIELEGIRFGYTEEHTVFSSLDLEIDQAALVWITGKNGAGKSTLLKLLGGIESPQAGRIRLPAGLLAHPKAFAYLPQRAFLESDWWDWSRAYKRKQGAAWMELDGILGLEAILEKARSQGASRWTRGMSGGERQRLCLARVFASSAGFLLLDEPTTWLSAVDWERIIGDLLNFWSATSPGQMPRGALVVSHEPFFQEHCARILRMDQAWDINPTNVPIGKTSDGRTPGSSP